MFDRSELLKTTVKVGNYVDISLENSDKVYRDIPIIKIDKDKDNLTFYLEDNESGYTYLEYVYEEFGQIIDVYYVYNKNYKGEEQHFIGTPVYVNFKPGKITPPTKDWFRNMIKIKSRKRALFNTMYSNDSVPSKVLSQYKNGNHTVTIYEDGTKVKETINPDDTYFTYDFAENFDIHINNRCNANCPMCHENSTKNGEVPSLYEMIFESKDTKKYTKFYESLHAGQEIACLSGDTFVYTPNGICEIKDLKKGDEIFNSENTISKIKKITKTNKRAIKLKFSRGLNVISSEDHPFMSSDKEILAINTKNVEIDTLKSINKSSKDIPIIDMSKYIHISKSPKYGRSGKIIDDTHIRLTNSGKISKRYISFDEDMAYLYGWYIAEGSRSGLTLGSSEVKYAEDLGKIWESHTELLYSISNPKNNSINLELKNRTFANHFFHDALLIENGARNKSLRFLHTIKNKELIRKALLGLIRGDGFFGNRSGNSKRIGFKTASKYLAYDFVYLLKKWFNIKAAVSYQNILGGMIENRPLPQRDSYSVEISNLKDLKNLFPEIYIDIIPKKINNVVHKFIVKDIEEYNDNLDLYDISLEGNIHTFPINGFIITHNCGGGNIFESDQEEFYTFLCENKKKGIISNITVNQIHVKPNIETLKQWINEKLVHGIGLSLTNSADEDFWKCVDELGNNVVIHTIAGILSEKDLKYLRDRKILILGYKDLRRGHDLLSTSFGKVIEDNMKWLKDNLKRLYDTVKLMSFDCLGIEQLNPKETLNISNEEWTSFFQGSDTDTMDKDGNITCATMYIDLCKNGKDKPTCARMSTAALDKRFEFSFDETIEEVFKKTIKEW